ncbi:hypothetical protein NKR23_g6032 [Pleurostoma richardsiae]|uniref:NAD(P)-binding protein n=1 Tax=Pleurostoma richardsiae TaxID=41990 RepID=A0AA38VI89_9PEZI|nr:hypothetical protein NKR23_g6032 [Pleurostoma richardsiae]
MSGILKAFTGVTVILNRALAWLDYGVHYASGYILYYVFHGMKPQTHTRPGKTSDGRVYSPSVVVTGASEGIGLATALHLASKGYNVFAGVKDKSEIQKVKDAVENTPASQRQTHGALHAVVMDVLSQESINKCACHVESLLEGDTDRPLVAIINNAGCCMISPMELTPEEDVRRVFELDFWAYVAVIRAFLPIIKQNKGRFINVGSYGSYVNPPLWVPYCAVKAAMEGMTRAWRMELMPFGVGMTSIRPGWTRSGGIGPTIRGAWDKYFESVEKGAIGVDSLGAVISTGKPIGAAEEKIYRPMIEKWYNLTTLAADGAAQPAEAVAATVHDALSDKFLLPYYTPGYDALLGQAIRDLVPESVFEYTEAKTFGCL